MKSAFNQLIANIISWCLIVLGTCYLVWGAWTAAYSPSMDYAVIVEMARNMAAGKDFPVFFYGQAYMGSFEPAISAVLCAVFGPSPFNVCMGTALFGIAVLFIVKYLGRTLGGDWGAVFALLLTVNGGFTWLHFMVSPRGGYGLATVLIICALGIASVSNLVNRENGKINFIPVALFGLFAGLAFWNVWLTFPAFAAAGLIIIYRLRWKVLSLRFVCTSLLTFFVGSFPWWIWVFRNGSSALNMSGGGKSAVGWQAISHIFTILIPQFYETSGSVCEFYRSILPWILISVFLLSLISLLIFCNRKILSFFAAMIIYLLIFSVVYSQTAFGAMDVTRYLVPFTPVFAIFCGSAIGCAVQHAIDDNRRNYRLPLLFSYIALTALYLSGVAIPSFRATKDNMEKLQSKGGKWLAKMNTLASDSAMQEAAYADFALFGGNWLTDRRMCLVSASRWRYDPYIHALEKASHPSVINDYYSFSTFCNASGGSCRNHKVGGFLLTDNIQPPEPVEEIQTSTILSTSLSNYTNDVTQLLIDDSLSTFVRLQSYGDSFPFIDIVFKEPVITAGASVIIDDIQSARGWKAELFAQTDSPIATIDETPHKGWFWSGQRQYQFGPDSRWTIRWPSAKTSKIRLTFTPGTPESVIEIPDLRILSDISMPDSDISSVISSVSEILKNNPATEIHAGRWLGNMLDAPADPALKYGAASGNLGNMDVCKFSTIDLNKDNVILLHGKSVFNAAATTLKDLGCSFEQYEKKGYFIIHIRNGQTANSERLRTFYNNGRLRFFGGRVMRETSDENYNEELQLATADFGKSLKLKSFSVLPNEITPGSTLNLNVNWLIRNESLSNGKYSIFIHGEQNGKIAFQGHNILKQEKRRADILRTTVTQFKIKTPSDISSEEISIYLCVKRPFRLSKRFQISDSALPADNNRLLLGRIKVMPSK